MRSGRTPGPGKKYHAEDGICTGWRCKGRHKKDQENIRNDQKHRCQMIDPPPCPRKIKRGKRQHRSKGDASQGRCQRKQHGIPEPAQHHGKNIMPHFIGSQKMDPSRAAEGPGTKNHPEKTEKIWGRKLLQENKKCRSLHRSAGQQKAWTIFFSYSPTSWRSAGSGIQKWR